MENEQEYEYQFVTNEEVEIIGHENDWLETFYTAKIIRKSINNLYDIEYNTVLNVEETDKLRATVHKAFIRPKPHSTFIHRFLIGTKVDSYMNGGWYTGKVIRYNDMTRQYRINFTHYLVNGEHHPTNMRIYQKWDPRDNSWKHSIKRMYQRPFEIQEEVEILGNEEGMFDNIYPARIASERMNNEYEIRYKTLVDEHGQHKQREILHQRYIRPKSHSTQIYIYPLGAKVDVNASGGWWTGEITGYDRTTNKYEVHLPRYNEVDYYPITSIRIHQDWDTYNNTWKHSVGQI